jgi:hypothetical protein
VWIAQGVLESGASFAGQALDDCAWKSIGSEKRGEAGRPRGKFGEQLGDGLAGCEAPGDLVKGCVHRVSKGPRSERTFRAREQSLAGPGRVVGLTIGKLLCAGLCEASERIEPERKTLHRRPQRSDGGSGGEIKHNGLCGRVCIV